MAQRFKLGVQRGVIVTDVTENSLAAQQGIEREDVITEVDGKPVTDVKTFREALNKADPKRGVLLYLDRKGSKTFAVLKAGGREPPSDRQVLRLPRATRAIPPTRQIPLTTGGKLIP